MINLLAVAFPPEIFDAAAKVTSWWGLGAFAIAAVVAILVGTSSKSHAGRFPTGAAIVIVVAVALPVAGATIVGLFPETPFRVTVTVEDSKGFIVNAPHVTCECGIQPTTAQGVAVFEIHPDDVPERKLTFFADDGKSSGKKSVSFGRTRSIADTITLTEMVRPQPVPEPRPMTWCDHSPAGAPYQQTVEFWPHEHFNGKIEGGDSVNPGSGWYFEWQAPGPVIVPVTFTHDGSHMEAFGCGVVSGRETVAFCHGWKNGGNFIGHMAVQWKQPCP